MRHTFISIAAAMCLVLVLVAPALASSGFAQCGGGANGYTSTGDYGEKTHTFGSSSHDLEGPITKNHGWFTGQQSWSVTPNFGTGRCLA